MLKLSQKDYDFILATYEHYPVSYDADSSISWRIVGEKFDANRDYVCVIGAFDGFHIGHRDLIAKARQLADEQDMKLVVCLFDPDPAIYFNPTSSNEELLTADERVALIMNAGADSCLCFTFDENLAPLGYKEFLDRLCSMFNLRQLCVGLDFKLGAKGEGSFEKIVSYGNEVGFSVVGIDLLMQQGVNDKKISSTTIREFIINGDIDSANQLLGHFSLLDGKVEHGRGQGTTFGFPTANIMCSRRRVAPASGVYCAWVSNGVRLWPSALHVGLPPTFNDEKSKLNDWLLEAFLLDCDENLYGQNLRVFLSDKIGESQKFDSISALEEALHGYINATKELLGDSSIVL